MAAVMPEWKRKAIRYFGYTRKELEGIGFKELPPYQQSYIRSESAKAGAKQRKKNEELVRQGRERQYSTSTHRTKGEKNASMLETKVEQVGKYNDGLEEQDFEEVEEPSSSPEIETEDTESFETEYLTEVTTLDFIREALDTILERAGSEVLKNIFQEMLQQFTDTHGLEALETNAEEIGSIPG